MIYFQIPISLRNHLLILSTPSSFKKVVPAGGSAGLFRTVILCVKIDTEKSVIKCDAISKAFIGTKSIAKSWKLERLTHESSYSAFFSSGSAYWPLLPANFQS